MATADPDRPPHDQAKREIDAERLVLKWLPWLRQLALREIEPRAAPAVRGPGSDMQRMPLAIRRHVERQFRIGYQQGYRAAMEDLRSALSNERWQEFAAFLDGPLGDWRDSETLRSRTPPSFDAKA